MEGREEKFSDIAAKGDGDQGGLSSEEPDMYSDEEEIEEVREPRASRGRLRIVLLGVLLLAAVGVSLFYLRGWWSRPVPPPAPSQAVKSEPPAPPTPSVPVPRAAPQGAAAPAPAPAERIVTPTPTPATGEFWVQVGAFANSKNAERLSERLIAERYPVVMRPSESRADLVVVRVGAYPDRRQAEAIRAELTKKGFTSFVLREKRQ